MPEPDVGRVGGIDPRRKTHEGRFGGPGCVERLDVLNRARPYALGGIPAGNCHAVGV